MLRQSGTVAEYHAQFEKLAHGVLLYNPSYDHVYFVTRFLTGLKEEIRTAIALHRPRDVDTASALAMLQEEELNAAKPKYWGKTYNKGQERPVLAKALTEKGVPKTDDKLSALKQYRRKNGLCFKCGGKWSTTHTCPDQVPLHVLEEIWDALEPSSSEDSEETRSDIVPSEEAVFSVQPPDQNTKARRQTLKLLARIGKQQLLVLVDSGSIGTFVSDRLVQTLGIQTETCTATTFKAANGGQLHCSERVPALQWWVEGHRFTTEARVLALKCCDMIVGEDWLEAVSPVWVDYKTKEMRITVKGNRVTLHGVQDQLDCCPAIGARKLLKLIQHGGVMCCLQLGTQTVETSMPDDQQYICAVDQSDAIETPQAIQQLLDQYQGLFSTPSELPPVRESDHKINLIPGAQPVCIRPYHYSPMQKNEIETQVKQMLKTGVIRHSMSEFASPVLLVRKKDGTWRFCVDYRHLNAITMKHKHPMPIVDELLEEISGAQWFTKLDFSAGYHQIRMAAGHEFKTAFRTHQGLYEFMVMPFGLTNAPATFQSLMNVIFAALLRQGVLVFMDDILIYNKTLEEHVQLLHQVFQILEKHQFFIKRSKCLFAQPSVEYLGHVISAAGVATDPSKIQAVLNWPTPKTVKELRGFLGLTGYYRKFVQHYGLLARPLTKLLKKGSQYQWTPTTEHAFQILKERLVQAPVLAVPNFEQTFILETDASELGIGAVLM